MQRRVVITGMGCVTPLGHSVSALWENLLAGRSGIAPASIFDAQTFPTTFAAEVKDYSPDSFLGEHADRHREASRNTKFALGAGVQAWADAGLNQYMGLDPTRVGVYLGGGEGPIDFDNFATAAVAAYDSAKDRSAELDTIRWAQTALEVLSGSCELEQDPNLAGGHLACLFDAQGPNFNTLTACAASTQAIGEAMHVIRYGDADVMITGGTHSMIHPLGITGFNRLTTLSTRNDNPRQASRPFDRNRDGFVLGEGAGVLILEELEHAKIRGAKVLAEIVGFGSTADAFRITDIHESGRGGMAAMHAAITGAGLTPGDIDYISAHGTGTEENDKIETLAIRTLFKEHAKTVAISSVKSMMGHLIAAAGAVELITCVLAIRDGVAPPTLNYETPDPNCDLDYVPNHARKMPIRVALSNSFGFGGQNDTLVIRAVDA